MVNIAFLDMFFLKKHNSDKNKWLILQISNKKKLHTSCYKIINLCYKIWLQFYKTYVN